MIHIVTDACINCKYQDGIEACLVDCFHEGEGMTVINTEESIDRIVGEPACPIEVIKPDAIPETTTWIALNQRLVKQWPNISEKVELPSDADDRVEKDDKLKLLSEAPTA